MYHIISIQLLTSLSPQIVYQVRECDKDKIIGYVEKSFETYEELQEYCKDGRIEMLTEPRDYSVYSGDDNG